MRSRRNSVVAFALVFCLASSLPAQAPQPVTIQVHYYRPQGTFPTASSYFGYDEPTYTYTPHGKKLLRELSSLTPVPVYVRVHNLLTSGDGSASRKRVPTTAYNQHHTAKP